jgi:hypothetical protein
MLLTSTRPCAHWSHSGTAVAAADAIKAAAIEATENSILAVCMRCLTCILYCWIRVYVSVGDEESRKWSTSLHLIYYLHCRLLNGSWGLFLSFFQLRVSANSNAQIWTFPYISLAAADSIWLYADLNPLLIAQVIQLSKRPARLVQALCVGIAVGVWLNGISRTNSGLGQY